MIIQQNLNSILEKLPRNITLVAVSKFQNKEKIVEAIEAGQSIFGENRVQEAYSKWLELKKEYPQTKLHLIGPLQTNKAGDAVRLFDVIETLDRRKLADCLIKEMQKQQRFIPCLIQVNIGSEPQKSGVSPVEADSFIEYCQDKGLEIEGLMCIPPEDKNPEPFFKQMKMLLDRHNLPILSMGMSGDYQIAIKFGATHIRLGTAIFGSREAA